MVLRRTSCFATDGSPPCATSNTPPIFHKNLGDFSLKAPQKIKILSLDKGGVKVIFAVANDPRGI